MRQVRIRNSLILLALITCGGCGVIHRAPAPLEHRPYLVHVPGISGEMWMHRGFVRALQAGGFDAETRIFDWTDGQFPLMALRQYEENRQKAQELADELVAQHRTEPDRPLYLTCESGGAAIAVWTLEQLPRDVSVEAVVMLAPALSPQYDLSEALRHVRQKMFVFSSRFDAAILNLGTHLFGTMDGEHGAAAGCVGFVQPAKADSCQYEKLSPSSYDSRWLWRYGYMGAHHDVISGRFASGHIAPLLINAALAAERSQPTPALSGEPQTPHGRNEQS